MTTSPSDQSDPRVVADIANRTNIARHQAAAHAVQTGVAVELMLTMRSADDKSEAIERELKHAITGKNIAMCDHAALVNLLIAAGVITQAQYLSAIAQEMEAEKRRYEERLREATGTDSFNLV